MEDNLIREAFNKAKQDIQIIQEQISFLLESQKAIQSSLECSLSTNREILNSIQQTDIQTEKQLQSQDTLKDEILSMHSLLEQRTDYLLSTITKDLSKLKDEQELIKISFKEISQKLNEVDSNSKLSRTSHKEALSAQKSFKIPLNLSATRPNIQIPQDILSNILKNPADFQKSHSDRQIIPADRHSDRPADKQNSAFQGLKSPIYRTSTGNKGVPADRQTDIQTDQQTINHTQMSSKDNSTNFQRVSQLITSLDSIKQEVRINFKRLTSQEFLVFSSIYQLEEEGQNVDYSLLANKLKLTESSIRDYTQKIIKKGIPLLKNKENNKKIYLLVSPEFKKIASLSSLIQLREL
jgi:hypothetical protein